MISFNIYSKFLQNLTHSSVKVLTAFSLLLATPQSFALEIPPEQYPFPTKDPFIATVLAAFSPSSNNYKIWQVKYRPERKKNVLREPVLNLPIYQQSKKAPLAIMLAGVGGNAESTNSAALADVYFKAGYHVITLPNNLSWSYTMSVSESALPGYMPRDSKEYYQFIQWLLKKVQKEKNLKFDHTVLVGFSNGGLLAGFLSKIDSEAAVQIFNRIVLINPAIDAIYGIQQLDYLNDVVGSTISPNRKNYIMETAYSDVPELTASKDPLKAFFNLLDKKKFKVKDLQWLIGSQYRQSLSEIILVSHLTKPRGLLKTPYSKYRLNAIEAEALKYNYLDYINKFLIPDLPIADQTKDFLFESSMYSLKDSLKNDSRVFVFTNSDDFIMKAEDIDFLRDTFNERLFLFPYGGHMGNIMVPFNVELYLKVSKKN